MPKKYRPDTRQAARFARYRGLWDILCEIGSDMSTASAFGDRRRYAALDAKYADTLALIRAKQEAA